MQGNGRLGGWLEMRVRTMQVESRSRAPAFREVYVVVCDEGWPLVAFDCPDEADAHITETELPIFSEIVSDFPGAEAAVAEVRKRNPANSAQAIAIAKGFAGLRELLDQGRSDLPDEMLDEGLSAFEETCSEIREKFGLPRREDEAHSQ